MEVRKYLIGYKYFEQTYRQIQQVLSTYPGLSCNRGPFKFPNGTTPELAYLKGTIPVQFKGSMYNIPICIWLLHSHPEHPPICYVMPTPDMQIKMSMYVDHSGKIYLPYLHDWNPNKDADLLGLIQVMIMIFGEHPPVFSKPKTAEPSSLASTPYPQQAYMPMPGSGGGTSPIMGGYPSSYPRTTPYPPSAGQMPMAYPTQTVNQASPYPPIGQPTPYPPQPTMATPMPPTPVQVPNAATSNSGTITDEHIKMSLLSAIEHKVKRRLEETVAQQRAELSILEQTASELAKGKQKINAIIDKLTNEKMELERNIILLREKEDELTKAIELNECEPEIDVDEAVTTTAPLYKQILNAYAEEAATEDAIYYMGEALRRGVIDLDVFLKQVRSLSRKQFKLRALMAKCRQKAGLAG